MDNCTLYWSWCSAELYEKLKFIPRLKEYPTESENHVFALWPHIGVGIEHKDQSIAGCFVHPKEVSAAEFEEKVKEYYVI